MMTDWRRECDVLQHAELSSQTCLTSLVAALPAGNGNDDGSMHAYRMYCKLLKYHHKYLSPLWL
jgi:hypothetical protein